MVFAHSCAVFLCFICPGEQLAVPDRVPDKGAVANTICHDCLVL